MFIGWTSSCTRKPAVIGHGCGDGGWIVRRGRHHPAGAQSTARVRSREPAGRSARRRRAGADRTSAISSRMSRLARALGKALFWDMQVGSDGVQACASCHFRAGADPRSKNQVSPGLKHVTPCSRISTYSTGGGPNAQLQPSDFPLTRLAIPGVRGALDPATDSNDAVSSQGVHHLADGIDPLGFNVGGIEHAPGRAAEHAIGDQRRVQSPSVLGRPRRERVQRRQSSRTPRPQRQSVPRRRLANADRSARRTRRMPASRRRPSRRS